MATGTLDSNDKGATAAEITVTTETTLTLYVFSKTGVSGNYRISMEVSPDDGTTWVATGEILSRPGIANCHCAATKVRAVVLEAQGATSTITVHVLAA